MRLSCRTQRVSCGIVETSEIGTEKLLRSDFSQSSGFFSPISCRTPLRLPHAPLYSIVRLARPCARGRRLCGGRRAVRRRRGCGAGAGGAALLAEPPALLCLRPRGLVNLPEGLAERFASDEHLRKYALIKAGNRDERSIVCTSRAEARRIAAFVRPIDDYSIITVSETVVSQFTAKSQSVEAMGKSQFQAGKDAVLGILAEMIGVELTVLAQAPHRSAA